MPSISKRLREAIRDQLADGSIGFNQGFTAALVSYGLDQNFIGWNTGIIWTSPSKNFLFGRVAPDFMDGGGELEYPIVTIDTAASTTMTTRRVISATFSGPMVAVVEVHLSWGNFDLLFDYASYGDAVEDAMFATINNMNTPMAYRTTNLAYNGRMSCTRGNITKGGNNVRQTITFQIDAEVHTL